MTVVPFPSGPVRRRACWNQDELQTLTAIFAAQASGNGASVCAIGATELGDPQFYVLGPAPEEECLLTVSRVGSLYLLEDGAGRVVAQDISIDALSTRAKAALHRLRRVPLLARVLVGFGTVRLVIEEKLEPILMESQELAVRMVPQLAALA